MQAAATRNDESDRHVSGEQQMNPSGKRSHAQASLVGGGNESAGCLGTVEEFTK